MRIVTATGFYPSEKMGGAEHQTLLLAKGLAKLGHDPVFLATNSSEEGSLTVGKISVRNIPGRRSIGWSQHSQLVAKTIREMNPDICYVRVFRELATIMPVCRRLGVPVVSMSVHAMETSPLLFGHHPRETIGHLRTMNTFFHLRSFLSIRYSAAHVCNTRALQRSIQKCFPDKSIRMIYNGSPVPMLKHTHRESTGQVIWVNNLKRFKRPEIVIELARRLPQFRFLMIGKMAGGKYGERLRKALQLAPCNLEYLGPMTIEEVNAAILRSDLLLYTSLPVEGFGSSFTQAWLRQLPTVSLSFDLDGILERERIGRCSRNFEQLVSDVQELMENEPARRDMGRRARAYAVVHHSHERMVTDYESLFEEILTGSTVKTELEMWPVGDQP